MTNTITKNTDHTLLMKTQILLATVAVFGILLSGCGGLKLPNPSGTLEATETDIASTLSARISELRAKLGTEVKAGDTLIVLDVELLRLQRVQTEAARASLHAQRNSAEDQVRQARDNLALNETTLKRLETLFGQGSATQQQVDEAQTRRDVTSAQVSAGRNQVAYLDAEEEKLNALLAVYDRQIRDGVIVAPTRGTVILQPAEAGEVAAPGAVLLRVADLSALELRVYLDEHDVDKMAIGQNLNVLVDALKNEPLTGRVTWVSSEAEFTPKNAQTRDARAQLVYAIKVAVPNPEGKLHIGMPAEAKLHD